MSARTMALHSPAELRYAGCDETDNRVTFVADSASQPGHINTIDLDTLTGDYQCDCKGAEHGRSCWHGDLIAQSWQASAAMRDVRWMTDARLVAYGAKQARMVAIYKRRTGRVLPMDALNLIAARSEYRRRQLAGVAVAQAA